MRDPHQVLGVPKGANAEAVKRAYRRLAKQYHPDTAGRDAQSRSRFQEITDAYRAIRDLQASEDRIVASAAEATRAYEAPRGDSEFDESEQSTSDDVKKADRQSSKARPDTPPNRDAHAGSDKKSGGRAAEFFENLRQAGVKPFRRQGDDLACSLHLPFLEAARGGNHRVTLPNDRTVDVSLPPGIEDGQQIRLRGLGMPGSAGGNAGDALVSVDIEPHPYFSREGQDIRLALPISIAEAVEGAKVQVPTITGRVWVTIPAGSNSGTVLRLAGKGLATPNGDSGHQLIELIVMLPDTPDAELADFIRRWPAAKSQDPRAAFGLN